MRPLRGDAVKFRLFGMRAMPVVVEILVGEAKRPADPCNTTAPDPNTAPAFDPAGRHGAPSIACPGVGAGARASRRSPTTRPPRKTVFELRPVVRANDSPAAVVRGLLRPRRHRADGRLNSLGILTITSPCQARGGDRRSEYFNVTNGNVDPLDGAERKRLSEARFHSPLALPSVRAYGSRTDMGDTECLHPKSSASPPVPGPHGSA